MELRFYYVIFRHHGKNKRAWAFILANEYREALWGLKRAKREHPESTFYLEKVANSQTSNKKKVKLNE